MIISKINIVHKKMRNFKKNFKIKRGLSSISVRTKFKSHLKMNGNNAIVLQGINKKLILLLEIKKKF
jgi:hypothetical protein